MDTFWLTRKIGQGGVRGWSIIKRRTFAPQLSFSAVVNELLLESTSNNENSEKVTPKKDERYNFVLFI